MSNSEQEQPRSTEKKYTESDMLVAFKHGIEYEPYNSNDDVNIASIPEKNRPFWGWLRITRFQYTTHGGLSKTQQSETPSDPD